MTDMAYLCHNCGSMHEVESIRENLMLDLRTAASYDVPEPRGLLHTRDLILRWRMARAMASALGPGKPPTNRAALRTASVIFAAQGISACSSRALRVLSEPVRPAPDWQKTPESSL